MKPETLLISNGLTRLTRIELEVWALEHLAIAPGLEVELDIYHPGMGLWRTTPLRLTKFGNDPRGNQTLIANDGAGELYVFAFVVDSYLPVPVSIYDLVKIRQIAHLDAHTSGWFDLLGDTP